MAMLYILVAGFSFLLFTNRAYSEIVQQNFKVQDRNAVMMWPLNKEFVVRSLVDCSIRCLTEDCTCTSFIYDSTTKRCSLGSVLLPVQPSDALIQGKLYSTGVFCNMSTNLANNLENTKSNSTGQRSCAVTLSGVTVESQPSTCNREGSDVRTELVTLSSGLVVLRDTVTDGGGWIIFQRRISGQVDFYLHWEDYKNGFGDYLIGEFYLGNEWLHRLTSERSCELRIDFVYNQSWYFANYSTFMIGNESDGYRLHVGGYSGTAGDAMSYHNNYKFSTRDVDNDFNANSSCAEEFHGAWWYNYCYYVNFNGLWHSAVYWQEAINWRPAYGVDFYYTNIQFCELKIRPVKYPYVFY